MVFIIYKSFYRNKSNHVILNRIIRDYMYHNNNNKHAMTIRPENNNSKDNDEDRQKGRPPPCTQKGHGKDPTSCHISNASDRNPAK